MTSALAAGVDIGGTKILGVVLDPARPRSVLAAHRVPTPPDAAEVHTAVADLVAALRLDAPDPIGRVGVGIAGLVDPNGVLHFSPHLPQGGPVTIGPEVARLTGLPVVVDNDANCHAWGELHAGAARGARDAVVVAIGTGIGAGVISDGRLLEGSAGFAGEPGHMVVDPSGPPCPCGRTGCWEQLASGTGLATLARRAAAAGALDRAVTLAGGDAAAVRGEHVFAAAREGDAAARRVVDEFARWLALGITNLINLLDPELVVLAGGVADESDLYIDAVRTIVAGDRIGGPVRAVRIERAVLGDRAAAIGAALL